MRTTIGIDDDLIPQLRSYAEHRDLSVAKAVSELVRKGLAAPLRTREVYGFHVAVLPPDSPGTSRRQSFEGNRLRPALGSDWLRLRGLSAKSLELPVHKPTNCFSYRFDVPEQS